MVANPISGDIVGGRHVLGVVIGTGGSGTVWQAHDQLLDRTVAIKELRLSPHVTDEQRTAHTAQAMVEARTTARLHHPGIVTVFDVVDDGIRPWIVMQYVDGRSLEQAVHEDGPWTPERAARLAAEILVALATAHAAGIIHRDVKPSNILVPTSGGAMLTDFSIARQVGAGTLANTGVVMGSPGYIAPERITNGQVASPADLFGLGATLFFTVEGHGPFESDDAMASAFAAAIRPHPRAENAGALIDVIDGLLVKDPRHRLTIEQALEMLTEILAADPAPAAAAQSPAPAGPATEPSAALVVEPLAAPAPAPAPAPAASAAAAAAAAEPEPEPEPVVAEPEPVAAEPELVAAEPEAAPIGRHADSSEDVEDVEDADRDAIVGAVAAADAAVDWFAKAGSAQPGADSPDPAEATEPDETFDSREPAGAALAAAAFDEPTPQPQPIYDLWATPPLRAAEPDPDEGGTPSRRRRGPILVGVAVLVILLVVAGIVLGTRPSHHLADAAHNAPVSSAPVTCCEVSPSPSAPAVPPSPSAPASPSTSPTPGTTITSITVSVTIGAAPACVGTVTATVHVNGPGTVRVSENATDSANTHTGTAREWTFNGNGLQRHTMNLGTVSGTRNGTVTVHSTAPNTRYTTRTWSAPAACLPGYGISNASPTETCNQVMVTAGGSIMIHAYNNSGPVVYSAFLYIDGSERTESGPISINPNTSFKWSASGLSVTDAPHTYYFLVTTSPPTGAGQKSAAQVVNSPCTP